MLALVWVDAPSGLERCPYPRVMLAAGPATVQAGVQVELAVALAQPPMHPVSCLAGEVLVGDAGLTLRVKHRGSRPP